MSAIAHALDVVAAQETREGVARQAHSAARSTILGYVAAAGDHELTWGMTATTPGGFEEVVGALLKVTRPRKSTIGSSIFFSARKDATCSFCVTALSRRAACCVDW